MFKRGKSPAGESGFSLLEVLFATVVVGIGFLAVARMHGMSISSNSQSSYMTEATYLAEDKLEELTNQNFGDIDNTGSPETGLNELGEAVTNGMFNRSWTVTDNTPGPRTKTVTVTVTYSERGINHTVVLTTVIFS